jgi:hypothetical protein
VNNGGTAWTNRDGERVATLNLRKNLDTSALHIDLDAPAIEEAICMLHIAISTLEDQRRIARMQQELNKPTPANSRELLHFGKH